MAQDKQAGRGGPDIQVIGSNPVLLWGMTSTERTRRIARAAGLGFPETAGVSAPVLLVNAGFAFDPEWLKHVAAHPGMMLTHGGVPVLAHPATYGKYRPMDDTVIRQLRDEGLFGLEVGHRDNTDDGKRWLLSLAKKFGLEVTGSSDYHGEGKPNRLAENSTSPEVLDRLVARATGSTPYSG